MGKKRTIEVTRSDKNDDHKLATIANMLLTLNIDNIQLGELRNCVISVRTPKDVDISNELDILVGQVNGLKCYKVRGVNKKAEDNDVNIHVIRFKSEFMENLFEIVNRKRIMNRERGNTSNVRT